MDRMGEVGVGCFGRDGQGGDGLLFYVNCQY